MKLVYAFFLLGFSFVVNAQHFYCGTSTEHERLVLEQPEIQAEHLRLEQFTQQYIQHHASRSTPIIIPVVFHILHQGGVENITDAQVLDGIQALNRDFNKQNADTADVTDPALRAVIANTGIEFRLANIDPQGNYTTGIDRIYTVQTYWGNHYSKLNAWPNNKYVNIWVVNHIQGGPAGIAWYPGTVKDEFDGLTLLHTYIGSIGTSLPVKSHTLTHEMGHYLNLFHTWGDTDVPAVACGDDGVNDTPVTEGWINCPGDNGAKQCNPNVVENYQNYMDYSYCYKMFTEGQKQRMLAALASDVSGRNNLGTYNNLLAAGVADTARQPAALKADFIPTTRYACIQAPVSFKSVSVNAATYHWEFLNAVPATSTLPNPTVQFLLPGWQPVTLTVTNATGDTSTKTDDLRVYIGSDDTPHTVPFFEGFEDRNIFNSTSGWASANLDENNTLFKHARVAHTGTGGAYLNNFDAKHDHDIDEIISPAIDLTPLLKADMNLSYYYSWTSANTSFNSGPDSICIFATTDCGKTWIPVFRKGPQAILAYNKDAWLPTTESAWKQEVVNMATNNTLYNNLRKPNVRFKFQVFSSYGGNNFFIDDIRIGFTATGIPELSTLSEATLFPNPSTGHVTLHLQLERAAETTIAIYNLTGQLLQSINPGWLYAGESNIPVITGSNLAKGIYIVRIQTGSETIQRKLVIE